MKGINFDFEITLGEKDYIVEVTNFHPGKPARILNRPEDSDPPEDAEADYIIYHCGKDVTEEIPGHYDSEIWDEIIQTGNDNCIGIQEDGLEQKYEQD